MKIKTTFAIISLFILVVGLTFNAPAYNNTTNSAEKLIYQGKFHSASKRGSGTASVYEAKGGKRILKLTNLNTSSGPDLFIYIFKKNDADSSRELRNVEYVNLGRLKSSKGNHEYEIPEGVDLESFRAVSVWCKEFGVNFTTASISKV